MFELLQCCCNDAVCACTCGPHFTAAYSPEVLTFCPLTTANFQDYIDALAFCRGMYLLLFLQFASSTFYDPARRALEPLLVPKKQLHLATTLDTFAWSVTVALGSSLGGAVVSKLGTTMCFVLDSCTFVCAAACVLILQVKSRQRVQYCSMCLLCTLKKHMHLLYLLQAR